VAVDLVGRYSLEQVAERLALNHQRLENRVEARREERFEDRARRRTRATGFVEVGMLGDGYTDECTIEVEDGSGGKLSVRLNGGACAEAAEIVKTLWGERA
jgi:hypothetical protein